MNNEDKIISMLETLTTNVIEIKQRVLNLEVTVENEVKRDIKIVAENHLTLNQKLDDIKGLNEKVLEIQNETTILKSITKDTLYDLKALKVVSK